MRLLSLCSAILAMASTLFAQGNTGTILGTITDPSGAVMPGVKVTVTNIDTGVALPATTNSVGDYAARFLIPGHYKVEASAPAFKKALRADINLDLGRELRVDFTLEPGAITQEVTVSATAALLETESGTLSATYETRQLQGLPIAARTAMSLAALAPGMAAIGGGPTVNVNGGISGKDPFLVNGAPCSLQVNTGTCAAPSMDVVGEVKVVTNSYSAEYGDSSGSVTIITTKSGTNEYHGNLFEYFANNDLNAGNYFTHVQPIQHFNQFGGTIGGPIRKNKAFVFFGFQDTQSHGTSVFTGITLPTDAMRAGNFSAVLGKQAGFDALGSPVLTNEVFDPFSAQTVNGTVVRTPFPNNTIPTSLLSPAALKLQALYPEPLTSAIGANYSSVAVTSGPEKKYDFRFDYTFNDNNRISANYAHRYSGPNIAPGPLPQPANGGGAGDAGFTRPDYLATVDYVHIFSPTIANDLHVNFFQVYAKRVPAGYGQVGLETFGINGMPNGNQLLGTPNINFGGTSGTNALGNGTGTLWDELQGSESALDQATFNRGRQTIKIGGEWRQIHTNEFQPTGPWNFAFNNDFSNQPGFASSGYDYASFLLGLTNAFTYQIQNSFFDTRAHVYAAYIQDDIRLAKHLTVNVGLRWDAPLNYHEAQNKTAIFNLNTGQYVQLGVNGMRNTAWNNTYDDIYPRFGLAWNPTIFGSTKTVIRAGFGMFTVGNLLSGGTSFLPTTPFFSDGDAGRYTTTDNVTWKTTLDNIPYTPASPLGNNSTSVTIFPAHNPMSYSEQWNLSVGHEFKGILIELGYAGQHGVHLPQGSYNLNAIPLALAPEAQGRFIAPFVPYPQYPTAVTVNDWIGSNELNELEVRVEKRYHNGISFQGAYTWQKNIEVGALGYRDPVGDRQLDRGLGGLGNPQRMTAGWVWELPLGTGRRWMSKGFLIYPLSGWEINGVATLNTGSWLTVSSANTELIGNTVSHPNLIGNPVLPVGQRSLAEWFNTAAFAVPTEYTAGNAGWSYMHGPGLEDFDLSVAKRFYGFGGERRYLLFRADAFNVSNTPAYGSPNTTLGSSTFGRITSASNSRTMQLALKFYY